MDRRVIVFAGVLAYAHAAMGQALPDTADATGGYPLVLTPARLVQSLQDVPASVTILTADMLSKFGILNVPDALRLVPGMSVTQTAGTDYRIDYHGSNVLVPRRMNVLIDGVSAYEPGFARVDWKNLPVAFEDIDRIEVTRGPDSVAYGPNSFLAVINVITKHPSDVVPAFAAITLGSHGTIGATVRLSQNVGSTALRLTVDKQRDSGFDHLVRGDTGHDSSDLDRVTLRTQTPADGATVLGFKAAYTEGVKQMPRGAAFEVNDPDLHVGNGYVQAVLTRTLSVQQELQVQASAWANRQRQGWTACAPTVVVLPELGALWRADPQLANQIAAGSAPTNVPDSDRALVGAALAAIARLGPRAAELSCASANQDLDERRYDLEIQDTYVASEQLRAVMGVGARTQSAESETYFQGKVSNDLWRVFGNVEYKPSTWVSINAGAYAEHDKLSATTNTSPRLAANLRLTPNQTLRVVWTDGRRTPDIEEQRADWAYTFTNTTPPLNGATSTQFYRSAVSPGGLHSEHIQSYELGYLLNLPELGLLLDAKAYDDRLTDLISEKLQLADFHPTNGGAVRLTGAEVQAQIELAQRWTLLSNYAYLVNHDATNLNERTQYSRNSGSVAVARSFPGGWTGSVAYFAATGDGIGQNGYGREDLSISRALALAEVRLTPSIIVRHLDHRATTYYLDVGDIMSSTYDSHWEIFAQVKASF